MERDADDHLADMAGEGGLPEQRCGTVTGTIWKVSGSGSNFWKVLVPFPVPTFEKLRIRFRFQLHI